MQAALPARGRVAPVGTLEREQVDSVARAQARGIVEHRHELRVKVRVHAVRVVEKLEIRKQRSFRKHVFDEQRLTPAAVSDDEVGPKSLLAQPPAYFGRGRTRVDGPVEFDRVGMTVDEAALIFGIYDLVHARHDVFIGLSEKVDAIRGIARQMRNHVTVLAREILVDEQIIHKPRAFMSAMRSSSSRAACTRATAASSKSTLLRRKNNSAKGCCWKQRCSVPGVKPQRCAIDVRPLAIAGPKPKNISCGVTEPAGDW